MACNPKDCGPQWRDPVIRQLMEHEIAVAQVAAQQPSLRLISPGFVVTDAHDDYCAVRCQCGRSCELSVGRELAVILSPAGRASNLSGPADSRLSIETAIIGFHKPSSGPAASSPDYS